MKKLISIILCLNLIMSTSAIGAYAKTKSYVKSLKLSSKFKKESTIIIPANKQSASISFKVTIKTKGNASTGYFVNTSNKSVVSVKARKNKVTLKAKKPGFAEITVKTKGKNKSGKRISKKMFLTVKTNKFGKVRGTITYFYNNYVGSKPDRGARVILYGDSGFSEETRADGTGNYIFDRVPVGEYDIYIESFYTSEVTYGTVTVYENDTTTYSYDFFPW